MTPTQLKEWEKEFYETNHVNPNCKSARFCNPHGETGEVTYDIDKIFQFTESKLKAVEEEVLEDFIAYLVMNRVVSFPKAYDIKRAEERYIIKPNLKSNKLKK